MRKFLDFEAGISVVYEIKRAFRVSRPDIKIDSVLF